MVSRDGAMFTNTDPSSAARPATTASMAWDGVGLLAVGSPRTVYRTAETPECTSLHWAFTTAMVVMEVASKSTPGIAPSPTWVHTGGVESRCSGTAGLV